MSETVTIPTDYRERIPEPLMHTLEGYFNRGEHPGHCLTALLSGDLFETFGRADEQTRGAVYDVCQMLYNVAPVVCYGNPQRVQEWIERGGLQGR